MSQAGLHTPGLPGFSLAFSPFLPDRIALASSSNFGLVGNGRLHIVRQSPSGLAVDKFFDTKDSLFDVAWSELNPNQVVSAEGSGSIKLWDVSLNDYPIRNFHEHTREVMSVDWSNVQKELFASSSWDGSIKLWNPNAQSSLATIQVEPPSTCIYHTLFSPHTPNLLSSVSSLGTFKSFDTRLPIRSSLGGGLAQPVVEVQCQEGETLTFDWNKYKEGVIATSGTDRLINIYDLRSVRSASPASSLPSKSKPITPPLLQLQGHSFAVRKLAWSPHRADVLASASYDMSCNVWSTNPLRILATQGAHTEFVYGIAWSFYEEGLLMTTGWDGRTIPWRPLG